MDAQEYNRWWNDFGRHIPPCDKLTDEQVLGQFREFGRAVASEISNEYDVEIQTLTQKLDSRL